MMDVIVDDPSKMATVNCQLRRAFHNSHGVSGFWLIRQGWMQCSAFHFHDSKGCILDYILVLPYLITTRSTYPSLSLSSCSNAAVQTVMNQSSARETHPDRALGGSYDL